MSARFISRITQFCCIAYSIIVGFFLLLYPAKAYAQAPGSYTQIALSPSATFALRANGQLWAWGQNFWGELGDGTGNSRMSPRLVPTPPTAGPGTQWSYVTAGHQFTVALRSDGSLWSWGNNELGRLGQGTITVGQDYHDALEPRILATPPTAAPDSRWTAASAGRAHTLALRSDGTLWSWGNNAHGELGLGTEAPYRLQPTQVPTPPTAAPGATWTQCVAGNGLSFAIRSDGSLWSWGDGGGGFTALGRPGPYNGAFTPGLVPVPATTAPGTVWTSVAPGTSGGHRLATCSDGSLWGWGFDGGRALGPNMTGTILPVRIPLPAAAAPGTRWRKAAVGEKCSLGLLTDGSLWAWGNTQTGQTGINQENADPSLPRQEYNLETWTDIVSGYEHSAGLSRGNVFVAGRGSEGQLGLGPFQLYLSLFIRIAALPLATATPTLSSKSGLYPNPAGAGSVLTAEGIPPGCQVRIVNALGQLVSTQKLLPAARFQVPEIPAGLYLVTFEQGTQRLATRRLVIQ